MKEGDVMRAVLLCGILSVAMASASCGGRQPLPPPPPPAPPPPSAPPAAQPAAEQKIWRPSSSRYQVPDPSLVVALERVEGGRREAAAEAAARAVTLLGLAGLSARSVEAPADLKGPVTEAARKAASAYAPTGGGGDVYILGEITPGGNTQVRLAAVDLREGKLIGESGYQGPSTDLDEILRRSLEQLLREVEAYWRNPARDQRPQGR
jgi:hypothetical protein